MSVTFDRDLDVLVANDRWGKPDSMSILLHRKEFYKAMEDLVSDVIRMQRGRFFPEVAALVDKLKKQLDEAK